MKNLLIIGISCLLCITAFIGYDYYRSYKNIIMVRTLSTDHAVRNVKEHLFVKDDKLGWKLTANSSVKHSEQGKFDVTYEIDDNGLKKINNSENSDFSIYFFGDSFTFGHGVNNKDTFTNIIKDKYLKKEINVYNTGVMGYGIVQMFQKFMNLKDQIQSGDIIIFTPISKDIRRNLKDFQFPYFVKFTNIMKLEDFPSFDNGVISYRKLENNFYNKMKLVAMNARYTGKLFKNIHNKFIPDTTKESLEMIKIIKRETEAKGGKFILFFLPKTEECLNGKYDVDISGFDYFDIMNYFPTEKEKLDKLRISKRDVHWKVNGHEIAAMAIVETLLREKIIPKKYFNPEYKSASNLNLY